MKITKKGEIVTVQYPAMMKDGRYLLVDKSFNMQDVGSAVGFFGFINKVNSRAYKSAKKLRKLKGWKAMYKAVGDILSDPKVQAGLAFLTGGASLAVTESAKGAMKLIDTVRKGGKKGAAAKKLIKAGAKASQVEKIANMSAKDFKKLKKAYKKKGKSFGSKLTARVIEQMKADKASALKKKPIKKTDEYKWALKKLRKNLKVDYVKKGKLRALDKKRRARIDFLLNRLKNVNKKYKSKMKKIKLNKVRAKLKLSRERGVKLAKLKIKGKVLSKANKKAIVRTLRPYLLKIKFV